MFASVFSSGMASASVPASPAALVRALTSDPTTLDLARRHGLAVNTVSWEDTGRSKGSCWGPNISDMTLVTGGSNMPVLRKPNFADLTSDQALDGFSVNVGNEAAAAAGVVPRAIPLREYLRDITKYTDARVEGSLLAERDTHVLASAQACVLPLKDGAVEFGVKLFNYQSVREPAVLVIVASAQGTSAHVVLGRDNTLSFNKGGKSADFVAERLRDDRARRGVALEGAMTAEEQLTNALLIFQVPLVVARREVMEGCMVSDGDLGMLIECSAVVAQSKTFSRTRGGGHSNGMPFLQARGMDHGVLSTTAARGPFPSLAAHTLRRDAALPIRCTIQYYHVTDAGSISAADMTTIAGEVTRHKPVGSLVVGGRTERPTEMVAPPPAAAAPAPDRRWFGARLFAGL